MNYCEYNRDRYVNNIQLLQSLSHAHIIRYDNVYIDPYTRDSVIIMPWAHGGDLKTLIAKVKSGQANISEFSEAMVWKYWTPTSSRIGVYACETCRVPKYKGERMRCNDERNAMREETKQCINMTMTMMINMRL